MSIRIDTNISDLFFNTDLSDTRVMENGQFARYDEGKMRTEAELFLGCLERLGVPVPSPEDLVADYYARV